MQTNKKVKEISRAEMIYWGVFFFMALIMMNLVLSFIRVTQNEEIAFAQNIAVRNTTYVKSIVLDTNLGEIEMELLHDEAPITVNNFLQLAESGFYDGTKFHKVVKGALMQGGDPLSREESWELHGTGGPGYVFEDEINDREMVRGVVAMANRGRPDTNGSQFFILAATKAPQLDGKHTIFAKVIRGMEVVDEVVLMEVNEDNHPLEDVVLESVIIR